MQDLVDAGLQTEAAATSTVVVTSSTILYDFNLAGDVLGGPTQMGTGNPTTMNVAINLPNIVCIDGGASDTSYVGQSSGPYGVLGGGGGGSAIIVEDEGVQLTSGVTKFNFVGSNVTVTNPTAEEILVTIGANMAETSSEYCPGYVFNRVTNTQFRLDLVDATALFRAGRRLKFTGDGANIYYGSIASSDYNTTNANDTTVNMTMEGTDVITVGVSDVCLTVSTSNWSVITTLFSGLPINDITSGYIGVTKYWIVVGNGGNVAYSTDHGQTWTASTITTTEHINCVAYDADNQRFMWGANAGVFGTSSNGTTWTEDTTTVPSIAGVNGTADIKILNYYVGESRFVAFFERLISSPVLTLMYSADNGSTWTVNTGIRIADGGNGYHLGTDSLGPNADNFVADYTDNIKRFAAATANSGSNVYLGTTSISAIEAFEISGALYFAAAEVSGDIHTEVSVSGYGNTDTTTITDRINDFAHSIDHARLVAVGDNATLAYLDDVNMTNATGWTTVTTGFNSTSNILCIHYDEDSNVFVACNSVGQVARSASGVT